MLKRQFSLRNLHILVALACVVIATCLAVYGYHEAARQKEDAAVCSNMDRLFSAETESILPSYITSFLPVDRIKSFEHVVEIDIQTSDLTEWTPEEMASLHVCRWVETLRIPNNSLSKEMFDTITQFPNLRVLYFRDWFESDPRHEIVLENGEMHGITIIEE